VSDKSVPPLNIDTSSNEQRIWCNVQGKAILKGTLSNGTARDGQSFIAVIDTDKQEVLIPHSNLSVADLAYAKSVIDCTSEVMQERPKSKEPTSKRPASLSGAEKVDELSDEPVEILRRTHPKILIGRRTRPKIKWAFRNEGSELPPLAPYCHRALLTSDLLPKAASNGDMKNVQRLLASGEHIESKGPQSWTETIRRDENQTTTKRHTYPETTALYRAAHAGWFDVVHLLLREGADVNTRNGYDGSLGDPILFDVIGIGNEKMARLLLEFGARMEAFGETTALHVASSHPKKALVHLVLCFGAHIEARNHLNETALYLASIGGFASVVEMLLVEGARAKKVNSEGYSALYKAAGKGRDDIVDLLFRYGADSAVGRGRFGETTIYKAAWYGELEVVELLLDFEADVNIRNEKEMRSYKGLSEKIFHGFIAGLSKDHAIMNAWGKTALHAAAYRGHEELVQVLLQAGADLEAAGSDGFTPMYLAAPQKHEGIVQVLLKAGAQLETERHDPVLALLDNGNKARNGKGKEVARRDDHRREMARIGTSDGIEGFVAEVAKGWSSSRRLK